MTRLEDWKYTRELQAIRSRLADHSSELSFADMNMRVATRYTNPPDEDAADQFLAEMAAAHRAMADDLDALLVARKKRLQEVTG